MFEDSTSVGLRSLLLRQAPKCDNHLRNLFNLCGFFTDVKKAEKKIATIELIVSKLF
jgi:hypothetical protein